MTPERKREYAIRIARACCEVVYGRTDVGEADLAALILPILEDALREMAEDVSADYARMTGVRFKRLWAGGVPDAPCGCPMREPRACWLRRHPPDAVSTWYRDTTVEPECACACHRPSTPDPTR